MTLREAARQLTRLAQDARDIAARVDGASPERWAAARDIRAVAANLDHRAVLAERTGVALGEPDPDDLSWLVAAAPGEVTEVFGR